MEVAGSLESFLQVYLKQIADYGYDNAPYEHDARTHELTPWPKLSGELPPFSVS